MKISNKLKSPDDGKHKARPKLSKDRKSNKPAPTNSPGEVHFTNS